MKAISLSLCAVAVGGSLLAQAPAQAQAPTPPSQGPATFKASTELVEVDVSVTGPDGKPIRGLTAADFAIVGQKIVAFQEVSHDEPDDPTRAARWATADR
jgi:hypothetical protein